MTKPQNILGALLAVQMLLTGGMYVHGRQVEARLSQSSAILAFDKSSVDKVVITDDKNTSVTLTRTGEGWTLPDYQKLPADANRVDELLATLGDLKGGWPVATSADSYEQFQVADKKFAHKVQLFAGDKPVAELLLGTSPGFRKMHVRTPKDSNIYAAAINAMDVPANNDQWLDHSLLKAKDLTEIKGKGFTLKKSGADWTLEGPDAKKLNADNAAALAKSLSGLRVESLQTTPPGGPPSLSLDVLDAGKPVIYQFWSSGDACAVRRSDNEKTFSISKPVYESIAGYDLAKLTQAPPPKPGEAGPGAAATPAPAASPSASATP